MAVDFTKIATDLMSQLGYTGMSIGLVLDSFGIPIPSEVLLPIAGALARVGRFDPWVVFIIGTLAQLVGGLVGYAIGRYGGHPLLERYGKYILISKRDLDRTHQAFEKYGPWLTMAGRCMPVIRGLVAYPAGIAEMNLAKFILFTTIGSAVWTGLFVYLGYRLGDNLGVINTWLHEFSLVVIVAIIILAGWHFRHPLANAIKRSRRNGS